MVARIDEKITIPLQHRIASSILLQSDTRQFRPRKPMPWIWATLSPANFGSISTRDTESGDIIWVMERMRLRSEGVTGLEVE
jgi:hypothetical protein